MSDRQFDPERDFYDSYYAAVAELRRRYLAGQLSPAEWTPSGGGCRGTPPVRRQRGGGQPPAAPFPLAELPAATSRSDPGRC